MYTSQCTSQYNNEQLILLIAATSLSSMSASSEMANGGFLACPKHKDRYSHKISLPDQFSLRMGVTVFLKKSYGGMC